MKILFWADGFWPRLGGIETQGVEFIYAMQERGHECRVMAQKDHPDWKDEETYRGIPVRRFDFNAVIGKRDLKLIHSIQNYLESILQEFRPDIIHLNGGIGGSAFVFLLLMKLFQVPLVFTAHAPYLCEGKFPPLIEKIAASMGQIGCVSDWVLEEMKKHLPLQAHKLKRIYNGLPQPQSLPTALSFSPPILLAFGRLSKEKGFDTAIRAFSLLKQSGSNGQLVIAGGGPERLRLEQLVQELSLTDSVHFTGVLSEEEVERRFNQATLVIVPSRSESFGLVILEAMQRGRPVIASRIEGVPEVISDGESGLLVPMDDPAAFCRAIQILLNDPQRAIQMGNQGRKRAEQFTIHQNAVHYEQLYENLILG